MQSLTLSTHALHSVHRFGSSRSCRRCHVIAAATPDHPSTSGRPDGPAAAPAAARGPAAAAGPGGRPRPAPRQMPPRIGPNGRPMMMGPDGQPVEVCAQPCLGGCTVACSTSIFCYLLPDTCRARCSCVLCSLPLISVSQHGGLLGLHFTDKQQLLRN